MSIQMRRILCFREVFFATNWKTHFRSKALEAENLTERPPKYSLCEVPWAIKNSLGTFENNFQHLLEWKENPENRRFEKS